MTSSHLAVANRSFAQFKGNGDRVGGTQEGARPRQGGLQSPKNVTWPCLSPCPCPRRWPPGSPASSHPGSVPGPPAGPCDTPRAASSPRARLPAGGSPAPHRGSRCRDGDIRGIPAQTQPLTLPVTMQRSSTSPQPSVTPAQHQTGVPESLGTPGSSPCCWEQRLLSPTCHRSWLSLVPSLGPQCWMVAHRPPNLSHRQAPHLPSTPHSHLLALPLVGPFPLPALSALPVLPALPLAAFPASLPTTLHWP